MPQEASWSNRLDLDDIQQLLPRPESVALHYEFVSFGDSAQGRAYLAACLDKVATAATPVAKPGADARFITIAFTWNGLRALGVDESSLATFPDEFCQGMAARAEILGDTGASHPSNWRDGMASPALHAMVILTGEKSQDRDHWARRYREIVVRFPSVATLSTLDLEAVPPYDYPRDHFGYRDRISQPAVKGLGDEEHPGSGAAVEPGEFFLGYPDEDGPAHVLPQPDVLVRNGSYVAYRRIEEHVGCFRDFLRENGKTTEEQELVAAKLMGRWRSGAPLVLAPERDDPHLASDPCRVNDFTYRDKDPHGYAVPLGSHMRRLNPRDTAHNMSRHRIIRRGGTYGRPLPEGAPDDGTERGLAGLFCCASLVRQFEFVQSVWINNPRFHELGNERDPIAGNQDGTYDLTIPKRPYRKKIVGLPSFTTVRGGAYFFLPGMRALRWLSERSSS